MSLEKNIERIADALEAIAKGAGGKTSAVQNPGGQHTPQGNGQAPVQQAPQAGGQIPVSMPPGSGMPWQGSGAPTGGFPVQQPGVQAQPGAGAGPMSQSGTQFQPPSGPGALPTTAVAQQYTFDQLAVATANLASSGKDVFTVLGRFGVTMLMDLPPEKYGEYAAALREEGAVI